MKVYASSFYSNKFQYRFAAQRLKRQLNNSNEFQHLYFYNESKLFKILARDYPKLLKNFMNERESKGFCYWAWKPIIILDTLRNLPENTILLYLDIGCNAVISKSNFDISKIKVSNLGIMTTKSVGIGIKTYGDKELVWTKHEVIDQLQLDSLGQNSPQIQATWIMILNNDKNRKLMNEWINLCTQNNFFLSNNKFDIKKQHKEFIGHRNDQSIFSCLLKKFLIKPEIATLAEMNMIRADRNLSLFFINRRNVINLAILKIEKLLVYLLNFMLNFKNKFFQVPIFKNSKI